MKLFWQWVAAEGKKAVSYRVEFWVGFLGTAASQFGVAFFVWTAVFAALAIDTLGGFSRDQLVAYALLVPLAERICLGQDLGFLAREIYEGTLSKFLVYPVSTLRLKLWSHLTLSALRLPQALLVLGLAAWLLPGGTGLTWNGAASALPALALGALVMFHVAACLETVAFWADNVWTLTILLRILSFILGCGAFPLEFFPEAMRPWLVWLPFHAFTGFPVRAALGHLTPAQYLQGLVSGALWLAASVLVLRWIWSRGLRTYSAVGM